ncbi:MAG TPA: heavy metal translocating P-type ATPase [Cyanobacteria bacterium UBA11370]|nr:heavy metal translocating P-type ATPase [Cyanobacteria bacterium UBA11370]
MVLTDVAEQIPRSLITFSVVHVVPGRIRFRVPLLAQNSNYADRLEKIIESDSSVTESRINRKAASIAICYNRIGRSDSEMRSHLAHLIQAARDQEDVEDNQSQDSAIGSFPVTKDSIQLSTESDSPNLKLPALATFLALLGLRFPIPKPIIASSIIVAALPVAKRAFNSLTIDRKLNIDCLDLIAITLSASRGNLLTPALVMTLHEIGDLIRDRTARVSHNHATDLLNSLAHYAWVEQPKGQKKQIPATDVKPGDTVIVYPGEQIPVDGKILRGKALIDQQKLTGESMPVDREFGQQVYASTLVRSGEIYIYTERVGTATRAGASIELVQQAPVRDTRMENYAAKIADQAVVPALILAGIVLVINRNPARAASILTLDFVTGIRVSLPTTFLAALNHATRHGVLIRSGGALEKLAQVDAIVFDKTGTLTQGDIAVVGVETVTYRMSAQQVLELAAAAEQRLTHPVAEAIMHYAEKQGIKILPRGEWNYEVGLGVRAEIEGKVVLVGSDRFLRQSGIDLICLYEPHQCQEEACPKDLTCRISSQSSLLYVAVDGEFQGVIQYTDPLRKESQDVIKKLQNEYGLEVHLLTGDTQQRAMAIAKELGIPLSRVHAEAFPEQKATLIRQLHDAGKTVAFTGDGLNDSVALAYADVSISFGNGSEVARETADVVLMNNELMSVLDALAIAAQTKQVIQQNIGLAVLPNLAALGLASTVGLHPLAATLIHNGSAIAAGLNGLRPLMHRDAPNVFQENL